MTRITRITLRRALLVVSLAISSACAPAALQTPSSVTPPPSEACTRADAASVALSLELERDGGLDRALVRARDVWKQCPTSTMTTRHLASILEELGRAEELDALTIAKDITSNDRTFVTAGAKRARTSSIQSVQDADDWIARASAPSPLATTQSTTRRAWDRALHRIELWHHEIARIASMRELMRGGYPESLALRLELSAHQRFARIGRLLIDMKTQREHLLQVDDINFGPDDRWLLLAIDQERRSEASDEERAKLHRRVAVMNMETGERVAVFDGIFHEAEFTPKATHVALHLGRPGPDNLTSKTQMIRVLSLAATGAAASSGESVEIEVVAPPQGRLQTSNKRLGWIETGHLRVFDYENKHATTIPIPQTDGQLELDDDRAFVGAGDDVYTIELATIGNANANGSGNIGITKTSAMTWAVSKEHDRLVWSPQQAIVIVRDLVSGKDRKHRISKLPEQCPAWKWSLEKNELTGNCIAADLAIEATTGKTLRYKPAPKPGSDDFEGQSGYWKRIESEQKLCKRAGGSRCDETIRGQSVDFTAGDLGILIELAKSRSGGGGGIAGGGGRITAVVERSSERVIAELADSNDFVLDMPGVDTRSKGDRLIGVDSKGRTRIWDLASGRVLWRGPLLPKKTTTSDTKDSDDPAKKLDDDDMRTIMSGDPAIARELGRCVIGTRAYPLEMCLGRVR